MIDSFLKKLYTIPNGELSIYLPLVTLNRDGKEINGTGHLVNDKEGNLKLTVIDKISLTKEEKENSFFGAFFMEDKNPLGELRSIKDYCYNLSACDEYGYAYECQYVDIGREYKQDIYSCKLISSLFIRSQKTTNILRNSASIVFKNHYDFSTNIIKYRRSAIPHFLEQSHDLIKAWEFKIDDLTFTYHKDLEYLQLDLKSESSNIDKGTLKRIIDTLDFVMGTEHLVYFIISWDDKQDFKIEIRSSIKMPLTSNFNPPYLRTGSFGYEEKENEKLFKAYYQYLKANPNTILTKWHKRIVDSGTGYYYRYGLILTIAIEELLKTLYPQEKENILPEVDYIQKKISIISKDIVDEELKKRVINLCNKLKETNYVPKKMLQKLEVEKKVISEGSAKSWDKLRNKYAHGKDYDDAIPEAHELVSHCLTIYYELIFSKIMYSGYYINSSKKDGSRMLYPLTLNVKDNN